MKKVIVLLISLLSFSIKAETNFDIKSFDGPWYLASRGLVVVFKAHALDTTTIKYCMAKDYFDSNGAVCDVYFQRIAKYHGGIQSLFSNRVYKRSCPESYQISTLNNSKMLVVSDPYNEFSGCDGHYEMTKINNI